MQVKYLYISFGLLLVGVYFGGALDVFSDYFLSSSIPGFTNYSSCVSWKASVTGMYCVILVLNLILPILWTWQCDVNKLKLGIGHFFGAICLAFFGWLLLVFGIPFGRLDGAAVFMAYLYCNYFWGSFFILALIGLAATFFTSYLAIVCKYFFIIKILRRA